MDIDDQENMLVQFSYERKWLRPFEQFAVITSIPTMEEMHNPDPWVLHLWLKRDVLFDTISRISTLMPPVGRVMQKRGFGFGLPNDSLSEWCSQYESISNGSIILLGIDPSIQNPKHAAFHAETTSGARLRNALTNIYGGGHWHVDLCLLNSNSFVAFGVCGRVCNFQAVMERILDDPRASHSDKLIISDLFNVCAAFIAQTCLLFDPRGVIALGNCVEKLMICLKGCPRWNGVLSDVQMHKVPHPAGPAWESNGQKALAEALVSITGKGHNSRTLDDKVTADDEDKMLGEAIRMSLQNVAGSPTRPSLPHMDEEEEMLAEAIRLSLSS